ncbi:MAG: DUF4235 domain-containing protein [Bacteroidota bacterium]
MSLLERIIDSFDSQEQLNSWIIGGVTMVSAVLVRRIIEFGWKRATHQDPPKDPSDRDVSLRQALTWTLLLGVTSSLVKLFIQRNMTWGNRN